MSNILKSGRKVHIVTFLDAWDAALLHSQADCPSHLAKCICMAGGQIELFVFNLFQTLTCIQQNQGLLTFLKSSQLCGSECCIVFIIINDNQNSDVILCSTMEERGGQEFKIQSRHASHLLCVCILSKIIIVVHDKKSWQVIVCVSNFVYNQRLGCCRTSVQLDISAIA